MFRVCDHAIFTVHIKFTQTTNHYDSNQEYVGQSKQPDKEKTLKYIAGSHNKHLVEARVRDTFSDCDLNILSIEQESFHGVILST